MGLNLMRSGTSAVVGVGSGVTAAPTIAPIMLGTTPVGVDLIVESLAVVAGAGMQLLSPFSMPDVADGLLDGGIALLAARGAKWALAQTAAPMAAQRMNPASYPNRALNAGRLAGSVGVGVPGVAKVTLR